MVTNPPEKNSIKNGFEIHFGMPNIIGAVDGTHVAIVKPPTENIDRGLRRRRRLYHEEDYLNRKGCVILI